MCSTFERMLALACSACSINLRTLVAGVGVRVLLLTVQQFARPAHIRFFAAAVTIACARAESFNAKFRDERRSMEYFRNGTKARVVIEQWQRHYNAMRPHSTPG